MLSVSLPLPMKTLPAGGDFSAGYRALSQKLATVFEQARRFRTIPLPDAEAAADDIMNIIAPDHGVLAALRNLEHAEDYTFGHSANVGIIAALLAKWMKCDPSRQRAIALAGLFHDIGKTRLPAAILNKPGPLNDKEWKTVISHPALGVRLLTEAGPVPEYVLAGVRQHHERLDGSGYPAGLSGAAVGEAARIIAIADIYDAMTSARVYRAAVCPLRVVDEMFNQMFTKLDPYLCAIFVDKARDSFVGSRVRLADGSEARIVAMDRGHVAKPVLSDSKGALRKNVEVECFLGV